jgi:hypothetical protein
MQFYTYRTLISLLLFMKERLSKVFSVNFCGLVSYVFIEIYQKCNLHTTGHLARGFCS